MAGYSGTPLAKKLGLKPGCRILPFQPPAHYRTLLSPLPEGAKIVSRLDDTIDIVHVFATRKVALASLLSASLGKIRRDAAIWVSWPKKASKAPTDITENTIREIALPLGLVDIKVCAVDDTWSGLKLVIRKDRR